MRDKKEEDTYVKKGEGVIHTGICGTTISYYRSTGAMMFQGPRTNVDELDALFKEYERKKYQRRREDEIQTQPGNTVNTAFKQDMSNIIAFVMEWGLGRKEHRKNEQSQLIDARAEMMKDDLLQYIGELYRKYR